MPADDLVPGSRLGGCRVLGLIGRGGMGAVYKAEDEQLGRVVALKVVTSPDRTRHRCEERFLREARAAAAVRHAGVVSIHRAGEDRGRFFLVLDYVPGSSLQDRIKRGGPLPWREAAAIGAKVAHALAAIHAAGVVHRDVKPANILLSSGEDGSAPGPRLTDFGLARGMRAGLLGSRSLTATGDVVGTPEFLAPEQAEGARTIDGQADLYGLGATLHALLTGEPPFRGRGLGLLGKHLLEKPRSVRESAPDVPASLERLVLRLLEKDPADRGAGASAVASELEAISKERGKVSRGLAAAAVVALSCLGVAAIVPVTTRGASGPRAGPSAPDRGSSPSPLPVAAKESPTPAPGPPASRWTHAKTWTLDRSAVSSVTCVVFSPRGERVLAGYHDGSLLCVDVASPESRTMVAASGATVRALAFLPDGRRVAVGRADGLIQLYDLGSGAAPRPVEREPREVTALAALPEERLLSGLGDGTVLVHDLPGRRETRRLPGGHGDWVSALAVAPDGRVAFSGSWDGSVLRHDFAAATSEVVFHAEKNMSILSLAVGGGKLAVGRADARVWLLPLADPTPAQSKRVTVPIGARALEVRPDGTFVALGPGDKGDTFVVHVDGVSEPYPESFPGGSRASVYALDGGLRYAARGTDAGRLEVARVARAPVRTYKAGVDGLNADSRRQFLRFLPDGQHAAIALGQSVRIVDAATGLDARKYVTGGTPFIGLGIIGGPPPRVAVAFQDYPGFSMGSFEPIGDGALEPTSLSKDGRIQGMVFPAETRSGVWWYTETDLTSCSQSMGETTRPQAHDQIRSIAVSSDGRRLVSGGGDGRFKVWSAGKRDPIATLEAEPRLVGTVAVAPDGKIAVAGGRFTGAGSGGFLESYRLESTPVAADGTARSDWEVTALALSDSGSVVLAGTGGPPYAKLWAIHPGEKPEEIEALVGHHTKVVAVAVSPDATRALTTDESGLVCFWDISPD